MPEFIPSCYLSISEALDRLGRELFPSAWTGEEHKARRGLIGKDEWNRIKDLPPARGSGAGIEMPRPTPKTGPHWSGDPSDPLYQEQYRANQRHMDAQRRLRQMLEAGELEAVIVDPWTGKRHQASASLWRRYDADQMIEKGQAPIPRSRNKGKLLVKQFAEANEPKKPLPKAKIPEAVGALKEKLATESLTRAQQTDFLRKTFPSYQLTERTIREIFRAVAVPPGRPKKSDKGV
jgi:hypothetical protein